MSPITYSGASCNSTASGRRDQPRRAQPRDGLDQERMLGDGIDMRALGLAVPARNARQAVAISSISMSSGDGSSRSSRRPDSMRCQARGSSSRVARLARFAVQSGRATRAFGTPHGNNR